MFTVSREFTFCYGHRLPDYNGKCANIHGHNGKVEILLESESLDSQGMVVDFSELKDKIGHWLEETLDHKLILRNDDPLVAVLQQMEEPIFLMENSPTAENLAKLVYNHAKLLGLPIKSVRFWETEKCRAEISDF
ncbi:MAG: 6-pyruvoyl trahydropterin synthase family protein [Thermoguttaceae bacterium]